MFSVIFVAGSLFGSAPPPADRTVKYACDGDLEISVTFETSGVARVFVAVGKRHRIGLASRHVEVVGCLEDYIVVTGYRITPVVALVRPGFDLALDLREVAGTFEVPLSFVLDARNLRWIERHYAGVPLNVAEFDYEGRRVWGATAAMLVALVRHLDRSRR